MIVDASPNWELVSRLETEVEPMFQLKDHQGEDLKFLIKCEVSMPEKSLLLQSGLVFCSIQSFNWLDELSPALRRAICFTH